MRTCNIRVNRKTRGPRSYLSGCEGNKIIDSERHHLSKEADDDAAHLVTRHRDVKKHLHTGTVAVNPSMPSVIGTKSTYSKTTIVYIN